MEDLEIKICKRMERLRQRVDRLTLCMDLHFSRVRLDRLLESDDATFVHDIVGINNNMNRETKQLDNCFVPRVGLKEEMDGI